MATFKPFKAIRPTRDKVHLVASRSYITYNKRELEAKLSTNPYSFIHIINPDFADRVKTKPNSRERLEKIKARFGQFMNDGIFLRDEKDCFYIYRQVKGQQVFTGIIGGASVDDYLNGNIKIHEQTITKREEMFKEYLKVCDFNAEPVCMIYPDNRSIDELVERKTNERPEYNFTAANRVQHLLWVVDDPRDMAAIEREFDGIPAVYIADGHHRSASSALLAQEYRAKDPGYTGHELYNHFMALLMPESQLHIMEYNRLVKDLNGLSKDEFLKAVSRNFEVKKVHPEQYQYIPEHNHHFSLYLEGSWYALKAKESVIDLSNPVSALDSYILTAYLLTPILGIDDLKTNKRIAFVGGENAGESMRQLVDNGKYKAGFGLFPVTAAQLKAVADAGQTMPPKSTWVEPKLRSGLTIYKF